MSNRTVTMGIDNEHGEDEQWTMYYTCPHCKKIDVVKWHKYCPMCGYKIVWQVEELSEETCES